ncbi:hypothetical protein H6F90_17030 [Trichocoleus sp. FACHB-591]|uniref:hypothetical protein n=1 Tax=Trichocoleus sp. FACHB-591 TaxID=2692872 RepID=UPI00168212E7|nr:hypothetical protein [Trichocoleus sp. FACHB-591]MBD2096809.1 hypothetical protein [Trichocoleus sp. FACHB-591]
MAPNSRLYDALHDHLTQCQDFWRDGGKRASGADGSSLVSMELQADLFELGHHSAMELLLPGMGRGCVSRTNPSHCLESRCPIQQQCAIVDNSMDAAAVGAVDA